MPTFHYLHNRPAVARQWTPLLDVPGFVHCEEASQLLTADCVIVHLPSILFTSQAHQLRRLREMVPKTQLWVAETMESAINFPQIEDPDFMALFDIEASYRQSADVWTPYIPQSLATRYRNVQPGRRKKLGCAFMTGNWNKSGRREYMRELMEYLEIDSFGRILNNKRLWLDRGVKTKLRVLRRYQYTLAFENSLAADYVTEKFYQPLLTGTILIYLGAPNIEEFAPGDKCFINVQDFASPALLAEFVMQADPAEYHSWRLRDLRPEFQQQLERCKRHWHLALAEKITERLEAG